MVIGIDLSFAFFRFGNLITTYHRNGCTSSPKTLLINPKVTPLSDEKNNDWEGCLSVPGMRGVVSRFTQIRYTGFDASGTAIDVTAEGFHARVVQHECDHLDGIIYTQRLTDPLKFGFTEELLSSGQLNSEECSD